MLPEGPGAAPASLPQSRLPASGDEECSGRGEKEGDRHTATVPPSCQDVCLEPFALSLPLQVAESRGEEFAPGKEHESLIHECLSHSTLGNGNVGGEEKQSLFFLFFIW